MLSRQSVFRSAATGRRGAVAAARLASAHAAETILEAGGNAVDAAVAAALVAGVIEPMETTLGGSGFMLVGTPGDGKVHAIEFAPRAPLAARPDMFRIDTERHVERGLGISIVVGDANVQGISASGVPATLRGLAAGHARFGRLPLAQVMAPAIAAAHDGFDADSYFTLEALGNLEALRLDPGARRHFLVNDLPPTAPHLGTASLGVPVRIRQAALGRTLERIAAHGVDSFYLGEIAKDLLATVRELGGLLSQEDLARCQPLIGEARQMRFRDVDLFTPHSPCGAVTSLQMLRIWEALHPDSPPLEDSPERIRDFAETSWHAFADRYHWLADADFVPVPERGLLSTGYAAKIADTIRAGTPPPRSGEADPAPWNYFASRAVHDPWAFEGRADPAPRWSPDGATEPTPGTTHVSLVDSDGMAVSITHTAANHFGGKIVCPRTGILFDAAMGWFNAVPNAANSIAGGKRPLANMGPMLIARNGQPIAAIGAPGGRRIISAMVQVTLNLVERRMATDEALAAPRMDASGAGLLISERLADMAAQMPDIAPLTRSVSEQHEAHGYELARPIIAVRHPDGNLAAAADPFTRGYALAI